MLLCVKVSQGNKDDKCLVLKMQDMRVKVTQRQTIKTQVTCIRLTLYINLRKTSDDSNDCVFNLEKFNSIDLAMIEVKLNDFPIECLIDSGALCEDTWNLLNIYLLPCNKELYLYGVDTFMCKRKILN